MSTLVLVSYSMLGTPCAGEGVTLRNLAPLPPPASETAAPLGAGYPPEEELEEVEESLPARAEVLYIGMRQARMKGSQKRS